MSGQTSAAQNDDDYCEYAGHEWTDAGGGLVICAVCLAEEWRDFDPAGFDVGESQDMLRGGYETDR